MTTDARALRLELLARQCADELRAGRRTSPMRLPAGDLPPLKHLIERLLAGEILSEVPY